MKPLYLRPWPEHPLAPWHWAYGGGRLADLLGLPVPGPTLLDCADPALPPLILVSSSSFHF